MSVFGVLLLCGFGLPIPEDITLVAGGVIAGLGYANVRYMALVGLAGVLVGDGLVFLAGRFYGPKILKLRFVLRILPPERFQTVKNYFEKYGDWVLFVARFLPGLRTPIFLTAGSTGKVSFFRFLAFDGLAALVSVPFWVYLGYHGSENRELLLGWIKKGQTFIFAFIAIGIAFFVIRYFLKKRKLKQNSTTN